MSSSKPSQRPDKFTIALFGKKSKLNNIIESAILREDRDFVTTSNKFVLRENDSIRIIRSPDFLDEDYQHPDQKIIDFMALSYPGPQQFILAIDTKHTNTDNIAQQIFRLQVIFGQSVTDHVVVLLENQESYDSVKSLKEAFSISMTTVKTKLDFRQWSSNHQPFQFDYKNYSKGVVKRRKTELLRTESHPQNTPGTSGSTFPDQFNSQRPLPASAQKAAEQNADGLSENVFNIILLGKSGTGKSASANTILDAANSHHPFLPTFSGGNQSPQFLSAPSSTPVTTRCEVRMMKLGTQFRVVDTPDFFYEEECVDQAQIEECKKYCQEGHCVVLLVIQLGRFTDGEIGILDKLEKNLGWQIRRSTIVLFTHGEDMKGDVDTFIGDRTHLKHIVEACGGRYHVFKNTCKDSKQVMSLVKTFPDKFPSFSPKQSAAQCCLF